jgi:TfoX/Sxy family transcriptional regulator of competence genes
MTWEKSSPALVALFAEIAPAEDAIQQKKMFGWPCCFVNGHLCFGLHKESIILRLSDADLAEFLGLDGAAEFEPMPGRKMKGYGIWSGPLSRDRALLARWIDKSVAFVRSIPAKEKRPAGRKKRAR